MRRREHWHEAVLKSPLGPYLNLGQINVPLMGLDDLRQVVERPASSVGLSFSDGLIEDIAVEASKLDNLPELEYFNHIQIATPA